MNYGRFFKLDTNKSQLDKGIAIFDYVWLKDEDTHGSEEIPEYPIYVVITKGCIEFKVHFYDEYQRHIHNTILSLLLSDNLEVKDGLTKSLIEGYDTKFPSHKNNYLYQLLVRAILKDEDNPPAISYSTLSNFNKSCKTIQEWNKNEAITFPKYNEPKWIEQDKAIKEFIEKQSEGESVKFFFGYIDRHKCLYFNAFIRKLILDFLFDLEHTKVFQNSLYYEYISVKLKENFFFNALANKAMYYYYRKLADEEQQKNDDRKIFFLKEYFLPAEEQWIKSIINPKAGEAFTSKSSKQGWFKIPDVEMIELQNTKENGENVISCFKRIADKDETVEIKIKKLAKTSSKWQLKAFDFENALPHYIFEIGGIFVLLALISISLPLPICLSISNLPIIVVLLFLVIYIYRENYLCRTEKYKRLKLFYSRGIHFVLPRLLGTIIAGWLMIAFASNVLPQFYAIVFKGDYLFVKNFSIILFLSLLTGVFVYDGISQEVPYLKSCQKLKRTAILMLIAFCYSYLMGIVITALIGTEAIRYSDKIYEYKSYYILIKFLSSEAYISPGFLLFFSFVAMFIGLFINRIFEDRQITDS
jgi:hypothetical protein